MTDSGEFLTCAKPECTEKIKNHKWAKIQAQQAGWFHSRKSGKIFCPKHVPDWVAGRR